MSALISMSELFRKLKEKSLATSDDLDDNNSNNSDSVEHNQVFEHNLHVLIALCEQKLENNNSNNDSNVDQRIVCKTIGTEDKDCDKFVNKVNIRDGLQYKCAFNNDCKKKYRSKQECVDHVNAVHTGEKPYKCDQNDCHFKTVYKKCLLSHLKSVHSIKKLYDNNYRTNKRYKRLACNWNDCDYKCRFNYELNRHKSKHTGLMPYKCKLKNCRYKTARKSSLDLHLERTHSRIVTSGNKITLTCDWNACEFKTAHRFLLKIHKRTHYKPFVCSKCGYKCAYEHNLQRHIKKCHTIKKRSYEHKVRA